MMKSFTIAYLASILLTAILLTPSTTSATASNIAFLVEENTTSNAFDLSEFRRRQHVIAPFLALTNHHLHKRSQEEDAEISPASPLSPSETTTTSSSSTLPSSTPTPNRFRTFIERVKSQWQIWFRRFNILGELKYFLTMQFHEGAISARDSIRSWPKDVVALLTYNETNLDRYAVNPEYNQTMYFHTLQSMNIVYTSFEQIMESAFDRLAQWAYSKAVGEVLERDLNNLAREAAESMGRNEGFADPMSSSTGETTSLFRRKPTASSVSSFPLSEETFLSADEDDNESHASFVSATESFASSSSGRSSPRFRGRGVSRLQRRGFWGDFGKRTKYNFCFSAIDTIDFLRERWHTILEQEAVSVFRRHLVKTYTLGPDYLADQMDYLIDIAISKLHEFFAERRGERQQFKEMYQKHERPHHIRAAAEEMANHINDSLDVALGRYRDQIDEEVILNSIWYKSFKTWCFDNAETVSIAARPTPVGVTVVPRTFTVTKTSTAPRASATSTSKPAADKTVVVKTVTITSTSTALTTTSAFFAPFPTVTVTPTHVPASSTARSDSRPSRLRFYVEERARLMGNNDDSSSDDGEVNS